jgi:hypothetical protein
LKNKKKETISVSLITNEYEGKILTHHSYDHNQLSCDVMLKEKKKSVSFCSFWGALRLIFSIWQIVVKVGFPAFELFKQRKSLGIQMTVAAAA